MAGAAEISGSGFRLGRREEAGGIAWLSAWEGDWLAVRAVREMRGLVVAAARAAAVFSEGLGWKEHGFAAAHDFTREELGRSVEWLRGMARLGFGVKKWPQLGKALAGEDGKGPLNTVAAEWICRAATDETIGDWIGVARRETVRTVKDRVRAVRSGGASSPVDVTGPLSSPEDGEDLSEEDPSEHFKLNLRLNKASKEGFEVGFELHHAVTGGGAPVSSFVEALFAEYAARWGLPAEESHPTFLRRIEGVGVTSQQFPVRGSRWLTTADLERAFPAQPKPSWPDNEVETEDFHEARRQLSEARHVIEKAGTGSAYQAGQDLKTLIGLEKQLRRILGQLLALLSLRRAWRGLGFLDLGHYAEERLGMARTTAQDLAQMARYCLGHGPMAAVYEGGGIGTRTALLIARGLGWNVLEDTLMKWLDEAKTITVKRLKDELDRLRHLRALGTGAPETPPDDKTWRESVARPRGAYYQKMKECMERMKTDTGPKAPLRLDLPLPTAIRFLEALTAAQKQLAEAAGLTEEVKPYLTREESEGRKFPVYRIHGVSDEALMLLLLNFARQWDPPEGQPGEPPNRIMERDGYRCTAPGCTLRQSLEVHHVRYRAAGGSNEDENRITLCRYHHHEGEHGGGMRVRGRAPLDLVFRQGTRERGRWFRNERRLEAFSKLNRA